MIMSVFCCSSLSWQPFFRRSLKNFRQLEMAAVNKPNQPRTSKETLLEKRAAVEAAFRKKKESESIALGLVEHMVENSAVDTQWLADNAKFINPQYYQDTIEERAIAKQCGFPVCHNLIEKEFKQKYRIDLKTNKVFDITQRKNFCSDVCFSASNHFKDQLLTSPLWMRHKEKIPRFEINHMPKKSLKGDEFVLIAIAVPDEDNNTEDDVEVIKEKTALKPKIQRKIVSEPVVNPCELVLKIVQQWFTMRTFKWLRNVEEEFIDNGVDSIQEKLIQMNINNPNVKEEGINLPRRQFKPKTEDQHSLTQVRAFLAGQMEYAVEKDECSIIKDNTGDVIENREETVSIIIPLANVSAQKNLRRKIVMDYVDKGFPQLTTITGLEFRRYQRDLIQLVSTFSLTADTITFRSHEIPFLCFILIICLATRDSTVKERLTSEPVKTEVSTFLADYERTMEQLEEYVIELCKPFENSPN